MKMEVKDFNKEEEEAVKRIKSLTYEKMQEITRKLSALTTVALDEIRKISSEFKDYPSIFMQYLYMLTSEAEMPPVMLIGMIEKLKFDLMNESEDIAKKISSKLFNDILYKSEKKDGMKPPEGKEVG